MKQNQIGVNWDKTNIKIHKSTSSIAFRIDIYLVCMSIFRLTYFFEINLENIAKIIITWKIIMNGFRFGYSHDNRNVHDSRLSLQNGWLSDPVYPDWSLTYR